MEPALGWTLLSRDALKQAETHLNQDAEGVLDEIGFLALHSAYANRFFPGTSVLLTRLRYALFVPWIYRDLERGTHAGRGSAAVRAAELQLVARLKKSNEAGIIGSRSYPNPTSQPPSMTYWNALGQWGLLRPLGSGEPPGRAAVHRYIDRKRGVSQLRNDDLELISEERPLFVALPEPPKSWADPAAALAFKLSSDECVFLRRHLASTRRGDGQPTLLARLADHRVQVGGAEPMTSDNVVGVADADDRSALRRSHGVASLAAIGRGVYAALVETIREEDDRVHTERNHRDLVPELLRNHRDAALSLDLHGVVADAPHLAGSAIAAVLNQTQSWLQIRGQLRDLHGVYASAEEQRKGRRARLPGTGTARKRRAEWSSTEQAAAAPLGYRWSNVRRLLQDLAGR